MYDRLSFGQRWQLAGTAIARERHQSFAAAAGLDAPRPRERRDTGARRTDSPPDDSEDDQPARLAAALARAAGIDADTFAAWGRSARAAAERAAVAEERAGRLLDPERRTPAEWKREAREIAEEVFAEARPPKYIGLERSAHIGRIVAEDVRAGRPLVETLRDVREINAVGFDPPLSEDELSEIAEHALKEAEHG